MDGGGQGGCDRKIEKFLGKFTKKKCRRGGGVRVDVNEELKFLCKFKKKNFFLLGGGGGGGGVGGRGRGGRSGGRGEGGWGGGVGLGWVRVDVNKELKFL